MVVLKIVVSTYLTADYHEEWFRGTKYNHSGQL